LNNVAFAKQDFPARVLQSFAYSFGKAFLALVLPGIARHNQPSSGSARQVRMLQVFAKHGRLRVRTCQSLAGQFQERKSGVTVVQLRRFGSVPPEIQ